MKGLPPEAWVGLACGVIFLVVLIKGLCDAAKEPDERSRLVEWGGECWTEPAERRGKARQN